MTKSIPLQISNGLRSKISLELPALLMTSKSGGLKPKAVAGGPSVTRFTHNSCTGVRPSGTSAMPNIRDAGDQLAKALNNGLVGELYMQYLLVGYIIIIFTQLVITIYND